MVLILDSMKLKIFFIITVCLGTITACNTRSLRWEIDSLRGLDPADFPADPAADITAAYTRTTGLVTEIRFDLLDLPSDPEDPQTNSIEYPTYYIAIDTRPGGATAINLAGIAIPADLAWDEMLIVNGDEVTTLPASAWLFPAVARDTLADTISIKVNSLALPKTFHAQVFSTLSGKPLPADQTAVFTNTDEINQQAYTLLAFYNTFPAATPAQALRRWDGAHTGPLGERHGLKHLLAAAQIYNTSLFLLDLKNGPALSALDTVGATKQIQAMQDQSLLVLADNAYGEEAEVLLASNTSTAQAFGLNPSAIYYGSFPPPPNYRYTFLALPDFSLPARAGEVTIFPMPNEDETLQPGRNGIPLNVRTQLLEYALNNSEAILTLGGDLPYSTWANWDMAVPALAYLAARPYIQLLDEESLLAFNVQSIIELPDASTDLPAYPLYNSQGEKLPFTSDQRRAEIASALKAAPQTEITALAWDMFFALTAPTIDPKLAQLRAQYLSDIDYFIAASAWMQNGRMQSTCDADINRDGLDECIVATASVFAVLAPDGARLLYLFARDEHGPHQIIAPGWQFETGLSDRSTWTLALGPAADAKAIAGALVDSDSPWQLYSAIISEGAVVFTTETRVKTYRFDGTKITVTYAGDGNVETQSALALDPWLRFRPGWAGRYSWRRGNWEVEGLLGCRFQAEGSLSGEAFTDSGPLMKNPEDPNLAYPEGHFLPYPLAVITRGVSTNAVELRCDP